MRRVVTGGAGFIGSNLVDARLDEDDEVLRRRSRRALLAVAGAEAGGILHAGDNQETSVLDVVRLLGEIHGYEAARTDRLRRPEHCPG